jgi:hypothetical protein
VLVHLSARNPTQQGQLQDEHRFTLRIEDQPARMVAGAWGTVAAGALTPVAGGWQFQGRLPVAAGQVAAPCAPVTHTYRYEAFELRPASSAGDGGGAVDLVGTAAGHAERVAGDALVSIAFTGALEGIRDGSRPELALEGGAGPRHPLDPVVLRASEPLPAGTVVALAAMGETVALDADEGERALWRGRRLLGFGRRYLVAPSSPLRDLAGNAADAAALPAFDTIADPGVLAEDGFEGEVQALIQAPAKLVSAAEAPPPAGQRSLLLPPAPVFDALGRFTARLAVGAGDRQLHLVMRVVAREPTIGRYLGRIRLAAPGHPPEEHDPTPGPLGPPAVTPLPAAGLWLSAPIPLALPLPQGTTNEVLLDVAPYVSCGPSDRSSGLLLDELRVE